MDTAFDWVTKHWDTSTVVAAFAFALALHTWLAQRRLIGRAHFTVDWDNRGSITYLNHGPGAAHDVEVSVPTSEDGDLTDKTDYVGAFQRMRIEPPPARFGAPDPSTFQIAWNDNRRSRQHRTLAIPTKPPGPNRNFGSDALEKAVRAIANDEARVEIEQHDRWKDTQR